MAAPTVTLPPALSTNEDTPLVINGFSVADTDSLSLTVTLTSTAGTLTLSRIAGLSFMSGDGRGDSTMSFSGSVADINAALTGLAYRPTRDFNGAGGFTYTVTDGANPASANVAITVNAVNDRPIITVQEPGAPDIINVNQSDKNLSVLLANGLGGFADQSLYAVSYPPYKDILLGDLNRDGVLDIVLPTGNSPGNNPIINVMLGDARGGFAAPQAVASVEALRSATLGDFDGDGILDIVTASAASFGSNIVLRGDGLGGFTSIATIWADAGPSAVKLGDLDGDGDLDVVTANADRDNVSVGLVSSIGGNGSVSGVRALFAVGDQPFDIALGDLNNDGTLDIATANMDSNNVSVLLNDGVGGFAAQTTFASGSRPRSIALGDINGDGALDVVTGSFSTNLVSVHLGNGSGGFGAATTFRAGNGLWTIALGDVNGDGDLDVVASSDKVSVLLGDGLGGFAPETKLTVGGSPIGVAIGDLDNARVIDEDTQLVFNAAANNKITLADADAGNGDLTMTLAVASGRLTLATTAGLAVTGNNSANITLTGTVAEINAALDGLRYRPGQNINGPDSLKMTVDDHGNGGGTSRDTATAVPIFVKAVDDPAVAQNDALTTTESTVRSGNVFANNGFGVDSDADGTLAVTAVNGINANVGAQITLPSGGTLRLNADGTFTYNPNGAFNALPAAGSGASNTQATVSFTYTLNNSDAATATITINGVDSDDTLRGTAGNDTLKGGIGNDTYLVGNAGDSIIESAGQGTLDRVLASVSYAMAAGVNVEQLATTNSLATTVINLTGNELANAIYGNAGVNVLSGGGGNDVIYGGSGNDVLDGGTGSDRLDGGLGHDTLRGGADNDTYVLGAETDTVIDTGGIDTVTSTINRSLASFGTIEKLTLLGTTIVGIGNGLANTILGNNAPNSLNGGLGNDILYGGLGNDTLDGGAGIDTMSGGAANDVYIVDHASDVVAEAANAGTDLVKSSVTEILSANVENLTLTGTAAINGTGNTLANIITGNANANTLDGGAGIDTLVGGAGNDTYVLSNGADKITDTAGIDAITSTITRSLATYTTIEKLTLVGTLVTNGTGNALANFITGNSNNNTLSGLTGNDTLNGGAGNDILIGGLGKDIMTGGAGLDDFDFNLISEMGKTATTRDVITDFTAGDDIDLSTIDANGALAGHTFSFLAAKGAAFTGAAGQLRWFQQGSGASAVTIIEGTVNADKVADLQIQLTGLKTLTAADFIL